MIRIQQRLSDIIKALEMLCAKRLAVIFVFELMLFIGLSVIAIHTRTPMVDEGWFALEARDLVQHGSIGSQALEGTGSWLNSDLKQIQEYTFWILPTQSIIQAVWYKIFGISLESSRFLSLGFAALALSAFYFIVLSLTKSRLAAAIFGLQMAIDPMILWISVDARLDSMTLAWGAGGIALYLALRSRNLFVALLLANTAEALAVFTHPNGAYFFLCLLLLTAGHDLKRLSWRHIVSVIPFLCGAALMTLFASQNLSAFLSQLDANAAARGGLRFQGLKEPLDAISAEMLGHQLSQYYNPANWREFNHPINAIIPVLFWFGCIYAAFNRSILRSTGMVWLLGMTGVMLTLMTLNGIRLIPYLLLIIPFYHTVIASSVFFSSLRIRPLIPTLVSVALFGLNVYVYVNTVMLDLKHTEYDRAIEFVKQNISSDSSITATAYFGFDLGFTRIRDDVRLGYFSGTLTDYVVESLEYRQFWALMRSEQPEIYHSVRNTISSKYRQVYATERYRIYQRLSAMESSLKSGVTTAPIFSQIHPLGRKLED